MRIIITIIGILFWLSTLVNSQEDPANCTKSITDFAMDNITPGTTINIFKLILEMKRDILALSKRLDATKEEIHEAIRASSMQQEIKLSVLKARTDILELRATENCDEQTRNISERVTIILSSVEEIKPAFNKTVTQNVTTPIGSLDATVTETAITLHHADSVTQVPQGTFDFEDYQLSQLQKSPFIEQIILVLVNQTCPANKLDHLVLYRPGTGTMWILKHNEGNFTPVFAQGDPGQGIGGYDLKSTSDIAFAFDYNHSGQADHLVLYRPGTGTMWILKNDKDIFSPVYAQGDPGNGIGGYDLRSATDQAFAFDYDHSGKEDHIVLYRPGTGTMWILKNSGGIFAPVFRQGDPGNGIGGYDLRSSADRLFAFDYDHSGKLDHIVLYRPGTGTMWILKNSGGIFTPVFQQGDPGNGIGGYDLRSRADRAFAFDFDSSGKQDHIVLYRPGTGTMWILNNSFGVFTPVFRQGDPGNGIGGYDLRSPYDRAFSFDFDHSGKTDHLVLYRPGTGTIWILRNNRGNFTPVYQEGDPGEGIGGYDLKSRSDRIFGLSY